MSTDGPRSRFVAPSRAMPVGPAAGRPGRTSRRLDHGRRRRRRAAPSPGCSRGSRAPRRARGGSGGSARPRRGHVGSGRGPPRTRSTPGRGRGSRCRAGAARRTRRPVAGARRSRSRRAPRRRRRTRRWPGNGCGHRQIPGRPSRLPTSISSASGGSARRTASTSPTATIRSPSIPMAFARGRVGSIVRTAPRMRSAIAADARLRIGVSHAQPRLRRSRRRLREAKGAQSPGSSRHPFVVASEEA